MHIHSWMVCHRPKSQAKPKRYGDRSSGGQRPTPVKSVA